FADHQLQVVKKAAAGTVATGVKPLSKQDRIGELARMISGAEITEKAKAHAKTLIEKAGGDDPESEDVGRQGDPPADR
ncbi:MAG TPA: hypothetical protein VII77_07935, partial [Candidatus Deferrimicrobium sp.]